MANSIVTPETITDILKRVQSIENMSKYSWITIAISIAALAISYFAYRKNSTIARDNALMNIKTNIDNSKTNYERLSMEVAALMAKKDKTQTEEEEYQIKQKILDSSFGTVMNAYDDGCTRYYKRKVNKKEFEEKYHLDIVKYVEQFPEMFAEPLTHYGKILRYYKENHKKQK